MNQLESKESTINNLSTEPMNSKNALIVFTRNPELGKCKTRLAATVGDVAALNIYTFLLKRTAQITTSVKADTYVFYSEMVRENDLWDDNLFRKKMQTEGDLGLKMQTAFEELFTLGYQQVIIIGSDLYDLESLDIETAFEQLISNDYVVGPAEDGGYYLLGMKKMKAAIFQNKNWGTDSVLRETLADLKDSSVALLEEKNDVDYYEDIKDNVVFKKFLTHLS